MNVIGVGCRSGSLADSVVATSFVCLVLVVSSGLRDHDVSI